VNNKQEKNFMSGIWIGIGLNIFNCWLIKVRNFKHHCFAPLRETKKVSRKVEKKKARRKNGEPILKWKN
jgi:hypothetical protein